MRPHSSRTTTAEIHETLRSYAVPLYTPQQTGQLDRGVQPEGTGSLLEVGDDLFLITASHVLDVADETHLLYPAHDEAATDVSGIRIRSAPGQDEYDIGVVRLSGIAPDPAYRRLRVSDVYLEDSPGPALSVTCGYPVTKNENRHGEKRARRLCYSIEWPLKKTEEYAQFGLDPHHHVALHYDPRDWKRRRLPELVGISGGPIWVGTPRGPELLGVVQRWHPNATFKLVHGSKATLALGIIAGAFPELGPLIPVDPMPQELIRREGT